MLLLLRGDLPASAGRGWARGDAGWSGAERAEQRAAGPLECATLSSLGRDGADVPEMKSSARWQGWGAGSERSDAVVGSGFLPGNA